MKIEGGIFGKKAIMGGGRVYRRLQGGEYDQSILYTCMKM
jgi:hypothetical protein